MRTRLSFTGVGVLSVLACVGGCGGNGPGPGAPTAVAPTAVAPTITRTVSGTVVEVDGGFIAGATITPPFPSSTFTDATGAFSIQYPAAVGVNLLTVNAPGFEIRRIGWPAGSEHVTLGTIGLQRTILLTEMSNLASILSPNDLPAYVGEAYESDYCSPCKPLSLRVSEKQNVRVTLKWSGGTALQLWASVGPNVSAIAAVAGPGLSEVTLNFLAMRGDTRLWVGRPVLTYPIQRLEGPVAFEVTTQPKGS